MMTNGGSGSVGRSTAVHWEGVVRNAPIWTTGGRKTIHREFATRGDEVDGFTRRVRQTSAKSRSGMVKANLDYLVPRNRCCRHYHYHWCNDLPKQTLERRGGGSG